MRLGIYYEAAAAAAAVAVSYVPRVVPYPGVHFFLAPPPHNGPHPHDQLQQVQQGQQQRYARGPGGEVQHPHQWPDIGQELPEGMQVKRSGDFSEKRNHCVSLQRGGLFLTASIFVGIEVVGGKQGHECPDIRKANFQ